MARVADVDIQKQQEQAPSGEHLPHDAEGLSQGQDHMVSLDAVKKSLGAPLQSSPLQGYLLKRSENLRIWNQRWFSLDPTTARMEYRLQRTDPYPRGTILFQADSTITSSPINFHGAKQYDGCCFYIGTAGKKEYFLAADTPAVARAWVATLRATAVVLKAHREAMEAEGGAPSKASMKALANATALARTAAKDAAKDIAEAAQGSILLAASAAPSSSASTVPLSGASSSSSGSAGTGGGLMGPFSLSSFSSLLPSTARGPPLGGTPAPHSGATSAAVAPQSAASQGPRAIQGGGSRAQKEAAQGIPATFEEPPAPRSGGAREGGGQGNGPALPGSSTPPHGTLLEALRARDEEIGELKELLQMREESLEDMRVRLEEAAVAAEKAADAAQHVGRERDRIRMEAARLCSDLEGRFGASDRQLAALQAERDGAVAALAGAREEVEKLRAALGSVAPGLLDVLGPSTLPPSSPDDAAAGSSLSQVPVLRPAEPDWPSEGWDTPETTTPTPSVDLSHLGRLPPSLQGDLALAPPTLAPAPPTLAPASTAPGVTGAVAETPDLFPTGTVSSPGGAGAAGSADDLPAQASEAATPAADAGEERGSAETLHTSGVLDSFPSSTAPPSTPAVPPPVLPPAPTDPSKAPTPPDQDSTEEKQGASSGDIAGAPDAASAEVLGVEEGASTAGQAATLKSEELHTQPDSLDSSAHPASTDSNAAQGPDAEDE